MLLFWSRLRAGAGEIRQFVSKSATNWRPLPFNPNIALDLELNYRAARHSSGASNLILGFSTFFR